MSMSNYRWPSTYLYGGLGHGKLGKVRKDCELGI